MLDSENVEPTTNKSEGNLLLKFSPYTVGAFTRATTSIAEQFNRLNFSIFDETGEKIVSDAQKSSDANYGIAAFTLPAGTYTIGAVAHNSEKSAPVALEEVKFSGEMTDVFYYYGTLEVAEEPQEYNIVMNRAVGMFRLILTDESIPEGVETLKISYKGSKTLNPQTGLAVTNANQTETRTIPDDKTIELYLIPHIEGTPFTVTVTALAADKTEIKSHTFEDIPISANTITTYSGKLFSDISAITSSTISFNVDPSWGGTNSYEF